MIKNLLLVISAFLFASCCNSYRESNQLSISAGILGDTTVVKDYSVSYYGNGKDMDFFWRGRLLRITLFIKHIKTTFAMFHAPKWSAGVRMHFLWMTLLFQYT